MSCCERRFHSGHVIGVLDEWRLPQLHAHARTRAFGQTVSRVRISGIRNRIKRFKRNGIVGTRDRERRGDGFEPHRCCTGWEFPLWIIHTGSARLSGVDCLSCKREERKRERESEREGGEERGEGERGGERERQREREGKRGRDRERGKDREGQRERE